MLVSHSNLTRMFIIVRVSTEFLGWMAMVKVTIDKYENSIVYMKYI